MQQNTGLEYCFRLDIGCIFETESSMVRSPAEFLATLLFFPLRDVQIVDVVFLLCQFLTCLILWL